MNRERSARLESIYRCMAHTVEKKPATTVVGAGFGDEGKGKVIDLLCRFFKIVARFSGGANAGHTAWLDNKRKLVTHLLPSGLGQSKTCVLGRGVFFDTDGFFRELEDAKKVLRGKIPPIHVDQQCPLWTPWHRLFEAFLEGVKGTNKINTTGRAIGPLAALNALRAGLHVGELFGDEKRLINHLRELREALLPSFHDMVASGLMATNDVPKAQTVAEQLLSKARFLEPLVCDTSYLMHEALRGGQSILFEGAQALGLDLLWGTYPFVSAGMSTAAGAPYGTGLPLTDFGPVILVAKLFPTRVGAGGFPSELWDRELAEAFPKRRSELFVAGRARNQFLAKTLLRIKSGKGTNADLAQYLQVLGYERGATTGRGRSVGMMDIPWHQYSIRVNGPLFLVLTRLDMASGLEKIPVVTTYRYKGQRIPAGQILEPWNMDQIEPVVEYWEGWSEDISGCQIEDELPRKARQFLGKLEDALEVPILLVGTGAPRDAVMLRLDGLAQLPG